jgi:hypothetical protein
MELSNYSAVLYLNIQVMLTDTVHSMQTSQLRQLLNNETQFINTNGICKWWKS